MPHPDQPHLLRERAESFGAAAADYDRYRPGYADDLLDQLAGWAGADPVLDIGAGTGKATAALAARGCDVLGVEVDAQMAAVAREHGVPVEVASFESWDPAGRTFGLVTAAQAWHWVDPQVGAPKLGELLRPGGSFVAFWNTHALTGFAAEVVQRVYAEHAPQIADAQRLGPEPGKRPYVEDLRRYGDFVSVGAETRAAGYDLPVEHWVRRVATHSDHLALGDERRAALTEALAGALSALGPSVHVDGGVYLIRAVVAG